MSNLVPTADLLPSQVLPRHLDGSQGTNRAQESPSKQISATTDLEAIRLWLAEYEDSPHTLRSYRKEVTRLLLWATGVLGKPISSLTREDLLAYEAFLASPAPEWINPAQPRHGKDRRLFDGPLSPRSIRQAMGILSGLFSYLVEAGYLAGNPLALRRRRNRDKNHRRMSVERYLDQELWQFVLGFIETLPQASQRDCQHFERVRWLFRLLYGTALRVSEVAAAKSSDLVLRRGKWWLQVVGKGDIGGDVPIGTELLVDLSRYRQFNGLSALPDAGETTPLILPITGRTDHLLTPTAVYLIVKEVFRRAAEAMGKSSLTTADRLRRASPHWLRHTSATHQADAGNDIRFIQKNLRHASIETTAIYLHAEDDLRHEKTTNTSHA